MSNKEKHGRRFSEEFKRDAVNLVVVEGYSYTDATRAVDVNYNTFRKWYDKYAPKPEPCGPDASVEQLQAEVKRLRRELQCRWILGNRTGICFVSTKNLSLLKFSICKCHTLDIGN